MILPETLPVLGVEQEAGLVQGSLAGNACAAPGPDSAVSLVQHASSARVGWLRQRVNIIHEIDGNLTNQEVFQHE